MTCGSKGCVLIVCHLLPPMVAPDIDRKIFTFFCIQLLRGMHFDVAKSFHMMHSSVAQEQDSCIFL